MLGYRAQSIILLALLVIGKDLVDSKIVNLEKGLELPKKESEIKLNELANVDVSCSVCRLGVTNTRQYLDINMLKNISDATMSICHSILQVDQRMSCEHAFNSGIMAIGNYMYMEVPDICNYLEMCNDSGIRGTSGIIVNATQLSISYVRENLVRKLDRLIPTYDDECYLCKRGFRELKPLLNKPNIEYLRGNITDIVCKPVTDHPDFCEAAVHMAVGHIAEEVIHLNPRIICERIEKCPYQFV